mgnify:CR=1 FL=1
MTTIHAKAADRTASHRLRTARIALAGNANSGKSSLFNTLTGLRARTANIAGTTTELREGAAVLPSGRKAELIDLPGTASLASLRHDERIAVDTILGRGDADAQPPDAIVLVIDATQLQRQLYLAGEVLELGIPTLVCLNMSDLANRAGVKIDREALSERLNCPVIPTVAHKPSVKQGVLERVEALLDDNEPAYHPTIPLGLQTGGETCTPRARHDWAEALYREVVAAPGMVGRLSTRLDRVLTHPILGLPVFGLVMAGLFYVIFALATKPMDWIEMAFGYLGAQANAALGGGEIASLVSDGIIAGVGGTLVFLPQICLLFFVICLLEDSGYLSRAALVMDRVLRRFGLPGQAFVPMLTAHACAIPGIMACRTIESKRDRLATILVVPLITCSARLPVYAMIAALLFADQPLYASLLFTGAYALGLVAAITMAGVFRLTLLRGESDPTVIELPTYKLPSLRNAVMATIDRGWIFTKKAGTVILAIVIVLWWASSYPQLPETAASEQRIAEIARQQSVSLEQAEATAGLEHSIAGRAGKLIEPVIRPLGFDWKIGVGLATSFAAREVVVGTLGVMYGVGEEAVDDPEPLLNRIRDATWPDGTPVFTVATSVSFLVFFVLAMQCLPTQAVARRETGSWKWPLLQLGYMTALAYVASLIAYQSITALTA